MIRPHFGIFSDMGASFQPATAFVDQMEPKLQKLQKSATQRGAYMEELATHHSLASAQEPSKQPGLGRLESDLMCFLDMQARATRALINTVRVQEVNMTNLQRQIR